MRDDIHKTAPIPSYWKKVMCLANRAADRGEPLLTAINKATYQHWQKQIRQEFLTVLENVISSQRQQLFPTDNLSECTRSFLLNCTSEERTISDYANINYNNGLTPADCVNCALKNVSVERANAYVNDIEGHWVKEGGHLPKDAAKAIHESLRNINYEPLITDFRNKKSLKKVFPKQAFDMDADLATPAFF